jgi:hypothetical protein
MKSDWKPLKIFKNSKNGYFLAGKPSRPLARGHVLLDCAFWFCFIYLRVHLFVLTGLLPVSDLPNLLICSKIQLDRR